MKKINPFIYHLAIMFLLQISIAGSIRGQEVFSIDVGSSAPFAPADILAPGPVLAMSDSAMAMGGVLSDVELDGISSGLDNGTDLLFSVDSSSLGFPGTDVFLEAMGGGIGPSDQTADIYRNPLMSPGLNFIFRDGDGIANPLLAPEPALGLTEPFTIASDNTDAYDLGPIATPMYSGPIFFTVGAAATGGFPTDTVLLVASPGASVSAYAGGLALALTAEDDIDAIFVLDDGDMAFGPSDFIGFSLVRESPSLSAGSMLSVLYAGGSPLSPADVFVATGGGGAFYVPASFHGLFFTDNIDALDQTNPVPDILLGDVNMDGSIDLLDVAPFVALISSGEYLAEADINEDGVVNLLDIAPFVALLAG